MKFGDYFKLSLNGHPLVGEEIVKYCGADKSDHLQKVGRFMLEWMTTAPTIKIQTSGSTGKPKIIEVEKQQMLQSAAATAKFFNFKKGESALLCLPMDYIAGKMMVVRALLSKLDLICISPNQTPLETIAKNTTIDFAPLTPMQLKDTIDTYGVRKILLGGGPISPGMEESFQCLKAEIYHGYGMTETLSHVALRRVNGNEKSMFYKALPGISFEKDERGCLVVHVPFLKNPVVTNDLIEWKDWQTFRWKGRRDHLINSGGIKLLPEEIEKRLHPFISERFFVAGLPDNVLGEKLCLFIEGSDYEEEAHQHLQEYISKEFDRYEKPKAIFFVKKFQTTPSGKIRRKQVIQELKNRLWNTEH